MRQRHTIRQCPSARAKTTREMRKWPARCLEPSGRCTPSSWPAGAGLGAAAVIIALIAGMEQEDATALGMAVCIEFGLGAWAGAKLNSAITSAIMSKHSSLTEHIGRVYDRLGMQPGGENQPPTRPSPQGSTNPPCEAPYGPPPTGICPTTATHGSWG